MLDAAIPRTATSRTPRIPLLLALALTLVAWAAPAPADAQPLQWTFHGAIADGTQFDAVRGPQGHVHLIAGRYYVIDGHGAVIASEDIGDAHHGDLDFPPAIAVGDDGTVHVVTRHDGDFDGGMDIRYRRRAAGGSWDRDYLVGSREKRNYVVGVADLGGTAFVAYTAAGDNVWGDVRMWRADEASATALGDISGIWRGDCGIRLRANHDRLFLASGKPDPDGRAYLLHAAAGGDLVGALVANTSEHHEGTDRRGFPDVQVDGTGHAHLIYGAYHTAHYNRYDEDGQRVYASDVPLFDGLGDWHMSAGLGAVGASEDGQTVVAVALRANGSQTASDSDLLWSYSLDGGASWSTPVDLGVNADGGEGRLLPRIVAVGDDFLLFYRDAGSGSISLGTMYVEATGDDDDTAGDDDDTGDDDTAGDDDTGDDDVADDDVADDDASGDDDAGDDDFTPPGDEGDCQCRAAGASNGHGAGVLALAGLGLAWTVRRRRARGRAARSRSTSGGATALALAVSLVTLAGCGKPTTSGPGTALGEAGQDEAVAGALADAAVAAAGMGIARHQLYGEAAPDVAALEALPGRRAFVCAYPDDGEQRCATGAGDDLAASIEIAAKALKGDVGKWLDDPDERAALRLKLDVTTEARSKTFDDEHDKPKARRVATYGYFVGASGGELSWVLPSEVLEEGLYDKKKGHSRKKIAKALEDRNGRVGDPRGAFAYEEFETVSWVERDQPGVTPPGVFRLYRLHPYAFAEATPDVLLQRMVWAADYLMSSISPGGKIRYRYRVVQDRDSSSYNLLRHGGTTYSLLQVYDRTRFTPYLRASEAAMQYLFDHCDRDLRTGPWLPSDHPSYGESMFIVSPADAKAPEGKVKLGGAGLALVMIDQYVEATGDTETYREQAMMMARFLVASQKEDGEFLYFPPRHPGGPLTDTDDSEYYPGEALLGLIRLYAWDRNPLWLETAVRGADWLIEVRDKGKGAATLANDHWLMLALSYLYLYTEDARYLDHSLALCRAVEYQYDKNEKYWDDYPDYQGGYYNPPRSTPAATRGEGLGAVLETCRLADRECGWIEFLLLETVRHEMLSQYDPDMSFWMPDRARAFGGWNGGLLDMDVRNDFVQHNMSSLLGLERHLLRQQGVATPGGPGWMEQRLDGTDFPGVPADELARLRAASLRYRGETHWEELVAAEPAR